MPEVAPSDGWAEILTCEGQDSRPSGLAWVIWAEFLACDGLETRLQHPRMVAGSPQGDVCQTHMESSDSTTLRRVTR